jgi:hypothetical protein
VTGAVGLARGGCRGSVRSSRPNLCRCGGYRDAPRYLPAALLAVWPGSYAPRVRGPRCADRSSGESRADVRDRDGAHGGNPHFYFLPPLVAARHSTGAFDPTLSPTLRVCALPACSTDFVALTTGAGPGHVTIDVGEAAYRVNWHTKDAGLTVGGQYRVQVFVATQLLGFLDLQVVAKGGAPAALPAGFVRLREGHPLLIKFRIEEGALAPAAANRIAFLRTNNFGGIFTNFDIFVVNADGTGEVQLTDAIGNDHLSTGRPAEGRSYSSASAATSGSRPTTRSSS